MSQRLIIRTTGQTGPTGATGPEGGSTTLTVDGQLLTRAGGALAPITRANLATDTAFSARYVPLNMADPLAPAGALSMSFSRATSMTNGAILLTGRETSTSVYLVEGQTYSSATFVSGTTAGVTLTNQWATLRSSAGALLRVSADDGATAWDASTAKTFTYATPFVAPSTGRYYVGLVVAAATVPTIQAIAVPSVVSAIPPMMVGRDNVNIGLTTPATAPSTSGTLTAMSAVPWVYLS